MPIATFPMYDWPEVSAATDALWTALAAALERAGFDTPPELSRSSDPMTLWRAPDLLLGQTCGYPYATRLANDVCLVGTPAYAIDCAPGHYFSAIVVRTAGPHHPLETLGRAAFAFNAPDSQSGFHAPARMFATMGISMPERRIETGSHRASIRAVAGGEADFAAIDAVTWELALRHEPAACDLTVLAHTPVTRGLPLITALENAPHQQALYAAVSEGIGALDAPSRSALLLEGLTRVAPEDYAPLAASGSSLNGRSA